MYWIVVIQPFKTDYCTLCVKAQLIPDIEHSVFLLERPINIEWGNSNFIVRIIWNL